MNSVLNPNTGYGMGSPAPQKNTGAVKHAAVYDSMGNLIQQPGEFEPVGGPAAGLFSTPNQSGPPGRGGSGGGSFSIGIPQGAELPSNIANSSNPVFAALQEKAREPQLDLARRIMERNQPVMMARGGQVHRTRGYMPPGQQTGAAFARQHGRAMTADDYYANRALQGSDLVLNRAAQHSIDPITGWSQSPTQMQIQQQLDMLAKKGDSEGIPGMGGLQQAALMRSYYDAKRSGNPAQLQAAADAVQGFKRNLNTMRTRQNAAAPALPAPAQDELTDEDPGFVPKPLSQPQHIEPEWSMAGQDGGIFANNGSNQQGPQSYDSIFGNAENEDQSETPGKKKGGEVADIHPYIVNEEGVEAFQPKGGEPELMPGGEHMTTFPTDGKVIPHGRTMRMLEEGEIENPQHLATGGDALKSRQSRGRTKSIHNPPPLLGPTLRGTHQMNPALATILAPKYNTIPSNEGALWDQHMGGGIESGPPSLPPPQPMSESDISGDEGVEIPTPEPQAPPKPNDYTTLLNVMREQKQQEANAASILQAKQRMMENPGVSVIPNEVGAPKNTASFATPYGLASVTHRDAGGPVQGMGDLKMAEQAMAPAPAAPTFEYPRQGNAIQDNAMAYKAWTGSNPMAQGQEPAEHYGMFSQFRGANPQSFIPRRLGGPVQRTAKHMSDGGSVLGLGEEVLGAADKGATVASEAPGLLQKIGNIGRTIANSKFMQGISGAAEKYGGPLALAAGGAEAAHALATPENRNEALEFTRGSVEGGPVAHFANTALHPGKMLVGTGLAGNEAMNALQEGREGNVMADAADAYAMERSQNPAAAAPQPMFNKWGGIANRTMAGAQALAKTQARTRRY